MFLKTIVALILSCSILSNSFSQNSFQRKIELFNGGNELSYAGIASLKNNDGYIIVGQEKGAENLFTIYYNACDEIVWKRKIQFSNALSVASSSHKLYAINNDELLIYSPSNGEAQINSFSRDKNFPNNRNIRLTGINTYEDNAYCIIGYDTDSLKAFIAKYSENNELIWSNFFKVDQSDEIVGRSTKDGGVVFTSGGDIPRIFLLDNQGRVAWRMRVFETIGLSSKIAPIEIGDDFAYIFPVDTINNAFRVAKFSKDDFHPIWVSPELYLDKLVNIDYLKSSNEIIVVGSQGSASQSIYFINVGTGELLNNLKKINSSLTVTDVKRYGGTGIIIVGKENNSAVGDKLFIRTFRSKSDLLFCGFSDNAVSNVRNNYGYGTGTYSTIPDKEVFRNQVFVNNADFNFADSASCIVEYKLDLNVELGNDTMLCSEDFPFTLKTEKTYPFNFWSNGQTGVEIHADQPGKYWLRAGFECKNSADTILINEFPKTEPDFTVTPTDVYPEEKVKLIGYNQDFDSVYWFVNDSLISTNLIDSTSFNNNGIFWIKYVLKDTNGCVNHDSISIELNFLSFFIPNTFTPNNDGINDLFEPKGFGLTRYSIDIFNRWGDLIFRSENNPWNGENSPNGIYTYIVNIESDSNKVFKKTGYIQLKR